jgi:hypothetical protein
MAGGGEFKQYIILIESPFCWYGYCYKVYTTLKRDGYSVKMPDLELKDSRFEYAALTIIFLGYYICL